MSIQALASLATRAEAPIALPALPGDVGLLWRPLTPDDVPALFTLVDAIQNADDARERSDEDEIASTFRAGWRDPARDSVVGVDAEGTLRAYAWSDLRPATEGTLAPALSGGVHPDHRRRGIGRALLHWSEARARQQLADSGSSLPARIRLFVDGHRDDVKAMADESGFTPKRWYVDMRRDLSLPLPDARLADGLTLLPYSEERQEDTRLTHNEAFVKDHWGSTAVDEEAWALNVIGDTKFRADWSFVVIDDATDRVVGYLMSGAYDQDWEPQGYTEGWTELLAVRREARGRGVAVALLAAAMAAYAASGMEYAGLDVDTDNPSGAFDLYTRLGYERRRGSVMYSKEI